MPFGAKASALGKAKVIAARTAGGGARSVDRHALFLLTLTVAAAAVRLATLGHQSFWYDETVNRSVAVSSEGLIHALSKIYKADRLVDELRPHK